MQSKDHSWISLIKKTEKERKKNKIEEHRWNVKKKKKRKKIDWKIILAEIV